jgi:hypothetical protein|tara:strand:- start:152 stop:580 length:429 start_codon:yes stop_codon:yes gene_type:complete
MSTTASTKFIKSFQKFTEDYNKEILEKISDVTMPDESRKLIEELLVKMSYKPEHSSAKNLPKKKREPTAYNLFMKDMIKELREKHPDIDKTDLMKRGAEEWQKKKALLAASATTDTDTGSKETAPVAPAPVKATPPPTKAKK